jgi:hypothetical protein
MLRIYIVHTIAFIIAPLFAGLGTGLAFYLRHPNDFLEGIETQGIFVFVGPNVYETPVTYGIVFLFGIPGYLILKKINLAKNYIIILYASLVGYTLSLISTAISSSWMTFVFPSIIVSVVAILILWIGNLTSKGSG